MIRAVASIMSEHSSCGGDLRKPRYLNQYVPPPVHIITSLVAGGNVGKRLSSDGVSRGNYLRIGHRPRLVSCRGGVDIEAPHGGAGRLQRSVFQVCYYIPGTYIPGTLIRHVVSTKASISQLMFLFYL